MKQIIKGRTIFDSMTYKGRHMGSNNDFQAANRRDTAALIRSGAAGHQVLLNRRAADTVKPSVKGIRAINPSTKGIADLTKAVRAFKEVADRALLKLHYKRAADGQEVLALLNKAANGDQEALRTMLEGASDVAKRLRDAMAGNGEGLKALHALVSAANGEKPQAANVTVDPAKPGNSQVRALAAESNPDNPNENYSIQEPADVTRGMEESGLPGTDARLAAARRAEDSARTRSGLAPRAYDADDLRRVLEPGRTDADLAAARRAEDSVNAKFGLAPRAYDADDLRRVLQGC